MTDSAPDSAPAVDQGPIPRMVDMLMEIEGDQCATQLFILAHTRLVEKGEYQRAAGVINDVLRLGTRIHMITAMAGRPKRDDPRLQQAIAAIWLEDFKEKQGASHDEKGAGI